MPDTPTPKNWWQTLPGVITGITATITAVTGLLVAITQTGWFAPRSPAPPLEASRPTPAYAPTPNAPPPEEASPVPHAPPAPQSRASVVLPALRDYTLGDATFTLVAATLASRTTEKQALTFRVRMLNTGRYDANFWDRSFRLLVAGVPLAPVSDLNEVVPGNAAKEGAVVFEIPRGTDTVSLQITHANDQTEIPLTVSASR